MYKSLRLTDTISLEKLSFRFAKDIVNGMQDPGIYENTLTVPSPYFLEDALSYIAIVHEFEKTNNQQKEWAIVSDGKLIGAIGLHFDYGITGHISEIGYWLHKEYRGNGIMTAVLGMFSTHVFESTSLIKLTAGVFDFNKASAKTLLKAGFKQEGEEKMAYHKDDRFLNIINFVLFKDE